MLWTQMSRSQKNLLRVLAQEGAYAYRKPRGVLYTVVLPDGSEHTRKYGGDTLWPLVKAGYIHASLVTDQFTITELGKLKVLPERK